MNPQQSQHSIKKINIDLNLNNKQNLKNKESFGLGLHVRESKSAAFRTILQKVYEAQTKTIKNGISIDHHSRVSKKEKVENTAKDNENSRQVAKCSRKLDFHEEAPNSWVLLNRKCKRLRRAVRQNQSKQQSMLAASPLREMAHSLVLPSQIKQQCVQKDRQSIDPYTNNQYRYIHHARIDSVMLSRCATSLKRYRNSITSSYKVSGIKLAPQETQKKVISLEKVTKPRKLSLSQNKIVMKQRKSSEVVPWQWAQQTKTQFL